MSSHLGLDFNRVEDLSENSTSTTIRTPLPFAVNTNFAVVDADDATNHLGDDNHVAQVGLDDGGLLVRGRLLLRLAELLDEAHRLALEATLEPTAGTGVHDLCNRAVCDITTSLGLSQGDNVPQRTMAVEC